MRLSLLAGEFGLFGLPFAYLQTGNNPSTVDFTLAQETDTDLCNQQTVAAPWNTSSLSQSHTGRGRGRLGHLGLRGHHCRGWKEGRQHTGSSPTQPSSHSGQLSLPFLGHAPSTAPPTLQGGWFWEMSLSWVPRKKKTTRIWWNT